MVACEYNRLSFATATTYMENAHSSRSEWEAPVFAGYTDGKNEILELTNVEVQESFKA